ncbi:MAG: hypothetical protein ABII93_06100 [Chrysiogenia bacterium]
MEEQRKMDTLGAEAAEALASMMDEKAFKRQLEVIAREREGLEDKAEKLGAKVAQEQVELDKQKTVLFAGIREHETKLRSDAQKTLTTPPAPGKKPVHYPDGYLDETIVKALEPRAQKIDGLRKRALELERMKRDLAKLRMEISMKAEETFRLRRDPARRFFLSLLHVAGVAVKYEIQDSSLSETLRWSDALTKLNERIAIAEGEAKSFWPLHYQASSADDCLTMALMVPEADVKQVLHAWRVVKIAGGKSATLTFDGRRVLRWRYKKTRTESEKIAIKSSDYSGGSTDRARA